MRPVPALFLLVLIALSCVIAMAADDVQVISSPRSTLSIYTYGGSLPVRIRSEQWEPRRSSKTGELTDIAIAPPLSSSTSVAAITPKPAKMTTNSATMNAPTETLQTNIAPLSPAQSGPVRVLPISQTITVGWEASPDPAVVGYQLYTGDSSGHYTSKTVVGNQISAELVVDASTLFIAVSAYTAEGLESVLSNEVAINEANQDDVTFGGGTRIISGDTQ
jgi:hypothetical protein